MASVGHVVIGMAAGRAYHDRHHPPLSAMLAWSAVSLLPDVDVVGLWLGVDYAAPWGHRGATHSVAFAVGVAVAIAFVARRFGARFGRMAFLATLVLLSHAVLDTMTDGGLGCALLWPFDSARYFAPWRPIPVAPIGPGIFGPHGLLIAITELVLLAPALLFALRPRAIKQRPVATSFVLVLWIACAWLFVSGDRARDAVLGLLLREDTRYSAGYSEQAFRTITPGKSDSEVRSLLGTPFGENWLYPLRNQPSQPAAEVSAAAGSSECFTVRFENGVVVSARDADACKSLGIKTGSPPIDVERVLGSPPERCWQYTWSRDGARHRLRLVCFTQAIVTTIVRRWE